MNDPVIQKLWHEVYGCNEGDPWIPVWAFIFRCHKPDLDVINRMLPPGDHAAFYQAYVQCHLFAEPHRRFTDYACSVYREFRRHAPARGGFVLAIGLLSRTRVDAPRPSRTSTTYSRFVPGARVQSGASGDAAGE